KTTIDMCAKRFRSVSQSTLSDSAHQVKASTWSIILIARDNICWTRFETQAAVNAGQKFLFFAGECVLKLSESQCFVGQPLRASLLSVLSVYSKFRLIFRLLFH